MNDPLTLLADLVVAADGETCGWRYNTEMRAYTVWARYRDLRANVTHEGEYTTAELREMALAELEALKALRARVLPELEALKDALD